MIRDPGWKKIWIPRSVIRDPGWKKIWILASGSGIGNKHPRSYFKSLVTVTLFGFNMQDPKFCAFLTMWDGKIRVRDEHPGSRNTGQNSDYCYCVPTLVPRDELQVQMDPGFSYIHISFLHGIESALSATLARMLMLFTSETANLKS